jgi:hypothetical protein
VERPYLQGAGFLARAGRSQAARALVRRFRSEMRDTALVRSSEPEIHSVEGQIAEAEGRWADAAREYRLADQLPDGPNGSCDVCILGGLAYLYSRAGMSDSVLAYIEQYERTPMGARQRTGPDLFIPTDLVEAIARAHEQRGDTVRAIAAYRDFVERWKDADPELRPRVAAARKRLEALTPVERPR